MPLDEIEMMNRFSEGRASIAYAQSLVAVKYLLETYGQESFHILLDSLRNRSSFDNAMMAAIGSDGAGFEKEFFDHLAGKYNLMTIFSDMSYLWLFLALVVIVGFILRYRRKRKYYRKWEEDEKYHSTDFDYGDPDHPEQVDDEDKPWA